MGAVLVLILILLPAAVGALLFALPRDAARTAKVIGCITALVTVALTIITRSDQLYIHWLSRPFDAAFHFGATGISFWIALLLSVSTFCALLGMRITEQRSFTALMLLLESSMLALFLTRDLLVFALCWDLMLIPVFYCLTHWGERTQTAWRYFLYNFAGGLALLLAVAAFGDMNGSTDVIGKTGIHLVGGWGPWILAGFSFAFLVKTPIWPLHTWMPITYTDTPSPMVAIVSAVQSKAGLYGFIAIGLPFLTGYMHDYAPFFIVLGVISLLYGAFTALVQNDVKRIVAYSSLSHLGLILLAIFSFNGVALQGAVVYIIAHGLFSAALFLLLGYVEQREGTRTLEKLGGLGYANPRLAGALCVAALAALGLPGLAGFVGEIVILTGVYQAGIVWGVVLALIPIVIAAAYMLRLYQGIMNDKERPDLPQRRDLTWIEGVAVAPLLAALVVLGVNAQAVFASVAGVVK